LGEDAVKLTLSVRTILLPDAAIRLAACQTIHFSCQVIKRSDWLFRLGSNFSYCLFGLRKNFFFFYFFFLFFFFSFFFFFFFFLNRFFCCLFLCKSIRLKFFLKRKGKKRKKKKKKKKKKASASESGAEGKIHIRLQCAGKEKEKREKKGTRENQEKKNHLEGKRGINFVLDFSSGKERGEEKKNSGVFLAKNIAPNRIKAGNPVFGRRGRGFQGNKPSA